MQFYLSTIKHYEALSTVSFYIHLQCLRLHTPLFSLSLNNPLYLPFSSASSSLFHVDHPLPTTFRLFSIFPYSVCFSYHPLCCSTYSLLIGHMWPFFSRLSCLAFVFNKSDVNLAGHYFTPAPAYFLFYYNLLIYLYRIPSKIISDVTIIIRLGLMALNFCPFRLISLYILSIVFCTVLVSVVYL